MMADYYYAITCCWETGKAYKLEDAHYPIMLQDKELDKELKNTHMLAFSKTNKETDAQITQTTYTSNCRMQEENTTSGTTTEEELFEILNKRKIIQNVNTNKKSK